MEVEAKEDTIYSGSESGHDHCNGMDNVMEMKAGADDEAGAVAASVSSGNDSGQSLSNGIAKRRR